MDLNEARRQAHHAYREKDYARAITCLESVSESNHGGVMNFLGYIHDSGSGVPQDYVKARQYYEKGATLGNRASIYNLALTYHEGDGVPANYAKAIELYNQIIDTDSDAVFNMGDMHFRGLGVPVDALKAVSLWVKSYQMSKDPLPLCAIRKVFLDQSHVDAIIMEHIRQWQENQDLKEENKMLKRRVEEFETEYAYRPGGRRRMTLKDMRRGRNFKRHHRDDCDVMIHYSKD